MKQLTQILFVIFLIFFQLPEAHPKNPFCKMIEQLFPNKTCIIIDAPVGNNYAPIGNNFGMMTEVKNNTGKIYVNDNDNNNNFNIPLNVKSNNSNITIYYLFVVINNITNNNT